MSIQDWVFSFKVFILFVMYKIISEYGLYIIFSNSEQCSLYKLDYEIILKDKDKEKQLMDKLRCRNGNLEISISALKRNESMEL